MQSVNKPTSFSDDQDFDPNSTPKIPIEYSDKRNSTKIVTGPSNKTNTGSTAQIQYTTENRSGSVPTIISQVPITQQVSYEPVIVHEVPAPVTTVTTVTTVTKSPSCKYSPMDSNPWPTIIISILGAIIVIYIAVAPNVSTNRRLFGIILMILWTIAWALILWVLWIECHKSASWWLLLIPVTIMAIFFILIIVMNFGSSI
jgi:hypothetical protein